jgi:hypothetical protein
MKKNIKNNEDIQYKKTKESETLVFALNLTKKIF